MTHPSFLAVLIVGAAVASAGAHAAGTDQAPPLEQQMINPSKSEPMMLEPSAAERAEAYGRDLAACRQRDSEERRMCEQRVDGQYEVETPAPADCEALEASARKECVSGARGGDRIEPVKSTTKNKAAPRRGFLGQVSIAS